MLEEILMAGFGGQGIMLMGQVIAYAALYEGLEVTFFPSYGPEMRGGMAHCTVVISNQRIGSPIRNVFSVMMAMNPSALRKFESRVRKGGLLAYNETLIDTPPERNDVRVVEVPATRIAAELGDTQVANMVAVGAVAAGLGAIPFDALTRGLQSVIPQYRHHTIPLNEEAIRRGMDAFPMTRRPEDAP